MSTVFSPSKARVTPAPAKRSEPKLRVVYGAPFRPPRMPFVIFVVSLLAAGLVGLLLLNTELQSGTFQVTALNKQADQLRDQQEQLEKQVRTRVAAEPGRPGAADGHGAEPEPGLLRLSDGRVLGVPEEGKAGTGTAMFGPGRPRVRRRPPVVPVKPNRRRPRRSHRDQTLTGAREAAGGTVKPPAALKHPRRAPRREARPHALVRRRQQGRHHDHDHRGMIG